MRNRRYWIVLVLAGGVVLPVIIGASCPAPSDPFVIPVTSNRINIGTQVPNCTPGFVCISVVNSTCVDLEISLYVQNGYDLQLLYCRWQAPLDLNTPMRASEECPGYNNGEYQVSRVDLFNPPAPLASNLYKIQGEDIRSLKPRESVLVQIQAADLKTFGLMIGRTGNLPTTPEYVDGPRYRCTMKALGNIKVPRSSEDVPSGETFQYTIYDQMDCSIPGLASLAIRTGSSSSRGCPAVSQ